ncbi:type 1 glutamine amidotransferase family protein [Tsukamurella soli]|uniref:Intracellular protease/amidase n=1 Tax=Tsukamurella soli TaxID=644556 RepID=A0ABP8J238_9ACTN
MTDDATSIDRPKALIVISSADQLPLSKPADESIDIGWFLVELAAVMARFEETHDFVLATPDGKVPTLDINGMALAMHGGAHLGTDTARLAMQADVLGFDFEKLRTHNPQLVARRESELALLRRRLGRMPVSQNLPKTDKEAASIRDEIIASLADLPEKKWQSIGDLVARHRDPDDDFSLADFDFMYAPGGHAPMVDFHDNPIVGELLNGLNENGVLIGLICHAPIAMTSARYRLDAAGDVVVDEDHAFKGAHVTTVPKYGELGMLEVGYPKIPGEKTRLTYYVDVALEKAGYDVALTLNPSAVKVVWDAEHNLLTGNGPQSVDAQADRLIDILRRRSTR